MIKREDPYHNWLFARSLSEGWHAWWQMRKLLDENIPKSSVLGMKAHPIEAVCCEPGGGLRAGLVVSGV